MGKLLERAMSNLGIYGDKRTDTGVSIIHHVTEMADLLEGMGCREDYLVTALFSYALDNNSITQKDLAEYGSSVVSAVVILSNEYVKRNDAQYLEDIQASPIALAVKNADLICRLREAIMSGNIRLMRTETDKIEYLYKNQISNAVDYMIEYIKGNKPEMAFILGHDFFYPYHHDEPER